MLPISFYINNVMPRLPKPECIYKARVNYDNDTVLSVWVQRDGIASCFARVAVPKDWTDARIEEQLNAMLCLAELRFDTPSTGERKWHSKTST